MGCDHSHNRVLTYVGIAITIVSEWNDDDDDTMLLLPHSGPQMSPLVELLQYTVALTSGMMGPG